MLNVNNAKISRQDIQAFEQDGVICLRGLFDNIWVERMRVAVDRNMANPPGPMSYENTQRGGRFLYDGPMWIRDVDFCAFAFESPAAALAIELLKSEKVNLLHDNLFVKEPGANFPLPWHNDLPYLPIQGWKHCKIWLALDRVTQENGRVEYIKGSHQWGKWLTPQEDASWLVDFEPYEILSWDLEPGDCLVHHLLTIHGSSGNTSSTRRRAIATSWSGDDVTYDPRPGTWPFKPIEQIGIPELNSIRNLKVGEPIDCDFFRKVELHLEHRFSHTPFNKNSLSTTSS